MAGRIDLRDGAHSDVLEINLLPREYLEPNRTFVNRPMLVFDQLTRNGKNGRAKTVGEDQRTDTHGGGVVFQQFRESLNKRVEAKIGIEETGNDGQPGYC